jgi:hypothetical protein
VVRGDLAAVDGRHGADGVLMQIAAGRDYFEHTIKLISIYQKYE